MFKYWYEMDNLYRFYNTDIVKQRYIKSFMNSIIEKHKHLESYPDVIRTIQSNFTWIENFDYSKLDIRNEAKGRYD